MNGIRQFAQLFPASSRRRSRWLRCATAAAILFIPEAVRPSDHLPSEYQVKAAYLLNFAKFIVWPAAAFETADSPFNICILGDDPFGATLDQLVAGETIDNRRLTLQRIKRPPSRESCQVLFVSKSEKDIPGILGTIGPGTLTVGDRDGFVREGGTIGFVIDDRRVRFDVNLRTAAKMSLQISARLLSVARMVQK